MLVMKKYLFVDSTIDWNIKGLATFLAALLSINVSISAQITAPPSQAPPGEAPKIAPVSSFRTDVIRQDAAEYNKEVRQYYYTYLHPALRLACSYCEGFETETLVIAPSSAAGLYNKPITTSVHKLPTSIRKFRWEIKSLETGFSEVKEVLNQPASLQNTQSPCSVRLSLPGEGLYEVKLTIDRGTKQEVKVKRIYVHQYLIGILGDSFASGEGDPEGFLSPDLLQQGTCEMATTTQMLTSLFSDSEYSWGTADWMEPMAHRSRRSGFYTAAQSLDVRKWTAQQVEHLVETTIIHLATSGAEIGKGLLTNQHSWQGQGIGQVKQLKQIIGSRQLDALIISIGGNDLGFGPTLTESVKWFLQNGDREEINEKLNALPGRYQLLKREIDTHLNIDNNRVFLTEYPEQLFSNDGGKSQKVCGVFEFMSFDIGLDLGSSTLEGISLLNVDDYEINLLNEYGRRLNQTIRGTCSRLGWNYVGGIANDFLGHGYCAGDTYFVGATESCEKQGDFMGTMHPNLKGHKVYEKRILEALKGKLWK
jgi:hypothetical protein